MGEEDGHVVHAGVVYDVGETAARNENGHISHDAVAWDEKRGDVHRAAQRRGPPTALGPALSPCGNL